MIFGDRRHCSYLAIIETWSYNKIIFSPETDHSSPYDNCLLRWLIIFKLDTIFNMLQHHHHHHHCLCVPSFQRACCKKESLRGLHPRDWRWHHGMRMTSWWWRWHDDDLRCWHDENKNWCQRQRRCWWWQRIQWHNNDDDNDHDNEDATKTLAMAI